MILSERNLNAFAEFVGKGNIEDGRKQLEKTMKDYKITEKSGNLVGVKAVSVENEVMLINTEGIIIRIKVADTALLGRVTSGVKLINLNEGVKVASIAKVREDKSLINEENAEESTDSDLKEIREDISKESEE